jgi:transcriptional regulator with XRE-family HTH domain
MESEDISRVGARLLEIRRTTGLSQADFGKLFDLSDRAYKNYELGIRDLPSRVAISICKKFGISANWLLLGLGSMSVENLAAAMKESKTLARQYAQQSERELDDERITAIEAEFLKYLLDEGLSTDNRLKQLIGGITDGKRKP